MLLLIKGFRLFQHLPYFSYLFIEIESFLFIQFKVLLQSYNFIRFIIIQTVQPLYFLRKKGYFIFVFHVHFLQSSYFVLLLFKVKVLVSVLLFFLLQYNDAVLQPSYFLQFSAHLVVLVCLYLIFYFAHFHNS